MENKLEYEKIANKINEIFTKENSQHILSIKITDDIKIINEFGGGEIYSMLDYNDLDNEVDYGKVFSDIHVNYNIKEKGEKFYNYYKDLYKIFLDGMNISFSNKILFILLLLHEIGHGIRKYNYGYKIPIELIDNCSFKIIKSKQEDSGYNFKNFDEESKFNEDMRVEELYAERFTFEQFPRIYNILKENNLI